METRCALPVTDGSRKTGRAIQIHNANPLRANFLDDRNSLAQHPAGLVVPSETDRRPRQIKEVHGDAAAISTLAAERQSFIVQRLRLFEIPLRAVQLPKPI